MVAAPSSTRAGGGDPTRGLAGARTIAVVSVLLTLTIALHSMLPGSLGTLVATALPWLGWLLPLLGIGALLTRRRRAWLIVLLPTLVWALLVGTVLLPLGRSANAVPADERFTVASHNVRGDSNAAAASARDLAVEGADVIALVELDADDREAAAAELAATHPYAYTVGTVGLWSVYPLEQQTPLDLGLGWQRALSADVMTPSGPVSVYVVHAASFRPWDQGNRDTMLQRLGELVPQDLAERVVVMGDFNATTFDPAMATLQSAVSEPRQSSPSWGFTWPSAFPAARIDHIFQRGMTPLENRVVAAGDSDHRAVLAVLRNE
ncbi:endonuclease/exonuclease/phosphatase family protein [Leucobacter rhizosphaerae]|uniref:Endonuclease/exonuclease/phosphatase family protein n=1 Tax=Leucobacter rhizosphaerae TaxID=2932245 RepID=A0ABY4FVP3_9MICO|nr:endonuclease/exonuclease/phosphatase family protein [Leucobacter rhizosphaerae]UOQ60234.1 endonuclease/exonuclease/phosphatase family protein [Leucobacter rhizosphaerae]